MSFTRLSTVLFTIAVLTTSQQCLVEAASILGFAIIGATSHQASLATIGLELVRRGHTFKLLLSVHDELSRSRLAKEPFKALEVLNFTGPPGVGTQEWRESVPRDPAKMMSFLKQGGIEIAQSLMEDSHAIAAMRSQNFDLVLRDIGSWPTHLPAEMLQIPEIDLIAISTLLPICANRWSIPNPISYIPQFTSSRTPNPGFTFRFINYLEFLLVRLVVMGGSTTAEKEMTRRYGYTADGSWTAKSTAAAYIIVGDWALEHPFPLPPKAHMVGALNTAPGKPLPANLQQFLDQKVPSRHSSGSSEDAGAVYVSMGTVVHLLEPEVHALAANLAALARPVLWKISNAELPGNMTVESLQLPPNVQPIPWAPQNDVLAHPQTKVFVTHAGANSIYEAAFHATPVVALPFLGDQPHNAAKSVYHGFGVVVAIEKLLKTDELHLRNAVMTVLEDPNFQVNATKVQRRMRKPRTAAQQAADVVEHVINVGGEDYLETAEHHLSWWQLSMIDVYLALLGLVAAAASLVGGTVWLVLRLCWHMWLSLSRSDQKQKKS